MQWHDTGFVLATRRHGESSLIVELLTREHGRHVGLLRGGQSPRMRAVLQPGNEVAALWRGRLAEHLGTFGCELVGAHAARFLDDPDRLAGLASAAALLAGALPEREPQPEAFALFAHLIAALDSAIDWLPQYVKWEQELLGATRCANCHADHHGPVSPLRRDPVLCVNCHGDLKRRADVDRRHN